MYPQSYGFLLFRSFELLDVFAPMDVLQFTAFVRRALHWMYLLTADDLGRSLAQTDSN